ncbi:MAG: hypothetical protein M1132_10850 [Chloroflexi bacterium]|nr:hypothetical protein [Chloroflexota bacterium]
MNCVFKLADLRAEWADNPIDLLTRPRGKMAFRRIDRELRKVPDGGTLVLDGSGIPVMDASFVDEAILALFAGVLAGSYGNRFLVLTNISEHTLYNLAGAVKNRGLKSPIPVKDQKGWHFIGPQLGERWTAALDTAAQHLVRSGELTARQLADDLHISINAASNRLRHLHQLRLAKRADVTDQTGFSHKYTLIA